MVADGLPSTQHIEIPLKKFLLIEACPPAWKGLDLYLFRDEEAAFYVGQSHLAFARVWEHLMGGFHGHSIVGRFVWANWPLSMKFSIELFSSQAAQFESVGHELSAAERQLIRQWRPCFNVSQNSQPIPVPPQYRPPNARLRCGGLTKLQREAARTVQVEETAAWVQGLEAPNPWGT
jgi:hypothetical protein